MQRETRREKMRPLAYLCEASSSVMSLIKTKQRARKKSSDHCSRCQENNNPQ